MTFAFWKKFPQFWSVKSEGLKSHAISLSGLKKIKHFRFQGVTLKYVGGQFRLLIFENQRYDNWFILNNIFIWGGNNRFTFPPQRGRYRVPRCLSWLRIQLCYFCGPDLISGPWTSACFVRLHPPPPHPKLQIQIYAYWALIIFGIIIIGFLSLVLLWILQIPCRGAYLFTTEDLEGC